MLGKLANSPFCDGVLRLRRAALSGAVLAAGLFGASSGALAAGVTIPLGSQENGYGRPTNITYDNLVVPKKVKGVATLTLEVTGNFDGASERLEIWLDGEHVGTVLDGAQPSAICNFDNTVTAPTTTVSISLAAATLAPLVADGKVNLVLKPKTSGLACRDVSNPCYSLRVASGSFYLNKALSPSEEQTLSAASLSKSRTAVTLSNLPNLSGRLSRASFRGGPSAPRPSSQGATAPSLPGGAGNGGGGVVITGGGTSNVGNFSFSGDISSMRSAAAAKELARRAASLGESRQAAAYRARNEYADASDAMAADEALAVAEQAAGFNMFPPEQKFDVWFGGSFSYFDTELGGIGQTGGVGSLQVGVDTRLSDDVLIGVALFGDMLRSDSSTGSQQHGLGVMAGPYAVIGLRDSLYLELMAAYGRAFNRINTSGLPDSRYQSQRLLATARLSGEWIDGPWSIRPSARATYYSERQESFEDGDGGVVPEEEAVLGQLRFGPELGHNLKWGEGYARPFMGFEGVWAFKQTDQTIDGVAVSGEDLTGSFSFGFDALVDGASLRAAGRYDGIGEPTLDALSGEITLRMPFN